jgi:low affinity Fe/Cu permease
LIHFRSVIVWAVTGPIFNFSDAWQLVINTGTTIVTFLMVFLIQNSQNRDSAAIQVKLDELIRVSEAHNSFVGLERLTGEELEKLSQKCAQARRLCALWLFHHPSTVSAQLGTPLTTSLRVAKAGTAASS